MLLAQPIGMARPNVCPIHVVTDVPAREAGTPLLRFLHSGRAFGLVLHQPLESIKRFAAARTFDLPSVLLVMGHTIPFE